MPRSKEDVTLAKCIGALQGLAQGSSKWEAMLTKHDVPVNEATDALHQVFAEREQAERERDEWKARAEQAEQIADDLALVTIPAIAERLTEALAARGLPREADEETGE